MVSISATEARRTIADLLRRSTVNRERIVIERRGRPVAALVSIEDLRRLEAQSAPDARDDAEPPAPRRPPSAKAKLGHWLWDDATNDYIYCSEELAALLGYSLEDYLASRPSQEAHLSFLHPADREAYDKEIRAAQAENRSYVIEFRERMASGDYRHFREFSYPVLDPSGQVSHAGGVLQDITDEIEAQRALGRSLAKLAETEAKYRRTERLAGIGQWEWDEVEDRCLYCSEELARLHGVTVAEFMAATTSSEADLEWIHPEDHHRYMIASDVIRRQKIRAEAEYRLVNPDGRIVHVREVMEPVLDAEGRLVRSVGYLQDISEQKKQQDLLHENEAMLRQASDMAQLGYWIWDDVIDRCVYCSEALAKINGVTPEEYIERWGTVEQLLADIHPDDRERYLAAISRACQQGLAYDVEFRDRHGEGQYRYMRERGEPVLDASGKTVRTIGTLQVVDDYKRAEAVLLDAKEALTEEVRQRTEALREANQALARSEAQMRALIDNSPSEIGLKDLDGRYLMLNPAAASYYDLTEDEMTGKTASEVMSPEAARLTEDQEREVRRTGQPVEIEVGPELSRDDRSYRIAKFPVRDAAGEVFAIGGIATDITDSRRTQAELQASRDQIRMITDNLPTSICHFDAERRYRFTNKTSQRWNAKQEQELLGRTAEEGLADEYEKVRQFFDTVYEGTRVRREISMTFGDGVTREVRLNYIPHLDSDGQVQGCFTVVEDLSEISRAERAIRTRDVWLRAILENAPTEIVLKDTDGKIMAMSKNVAEILERPYEDCIGCTSAELLPEAVAEIYMAADREVLESGRSLQQEVEEDHDGIARHCLNAKFPLRDDKGQITGICSLTSDITHIKEMQAQLHQANKMETIGQLTGGIAHDFNNLMAVILGNADLLREGLDEASEPLAAILRAGRRGAELTQRLLAYSRRQSLQPRPLDLKGLVSDMRSLLSRTLGATIAVEIEVEGGNWPALADPNQVESALLNLGINARDAMPEGGRLTIRTINRRLDPQEAARSAGLAAGDYAVLEVSDSGTGMPEEVRSRATEPFFTTKPMGRGTGLGLSMIDGFASQSNGGLEIESQPGEGTTVRLYLPRAERRKEPPRPKAKEGIERGRGETIMVVEDDPDVLTLTVMVIEGLGYQVLSAPSAENALEQLEAGAAIDVLLTDVVLSGDMSGPQLADRVSEAVPDARILMATGYSPEDLALESDDWRDRELLHKPYGKRELAAKLRELLDDPEAPENAAAGDSAAAGG